MARFIFKSLLFLGAFLFSFSVFSVVTVPATPLYAPAKSTPNYTGVCYLNLFGGYSKYDSGYDLTTCVAGYNEQGSNPNLHFAAINPAIVDKSDSVKSITACVYDTWNGPDTCVQKTIAELRSVVSSFSYSCPPDDHPDYTDGPKASPEWSGDPSDPAAPQVCVSATNKCPLGFLPEPIPNPSGDGQVCVSISCPDAGKTGTFWVNNASALGTIPPQSFGVFCDINQCAYSVNGGFVAFPGQTTRQTGTGVSLGASCGAFGEESYTNGVPNDNCTFTDTESGQPFAVCVDGTHGDDGFDTDPYKEDDTTTSQDFEVCEQGDLMCFNGNTIKAIENNAQSITSKMESLHNKQIDSDAANVDRLVNEIRDFAEQMNKSQTRIAEGIEGSSGTNGGSGGSSAPWGLNNLTNLDSSPSGGDTEGLGFDASDVPSDFEQTVSLDNYAESYSGWLPNQSSCPKWPDFGDIHILTKVIPVKFDDAILCNILNSMKTFLQIFGWIAVLRIMYGTQSFRSGSFS